VENQKVNRTRNEVPCPAHWNVPLHLLPATLAAYCRGREVLFTEFNAEVLDFTFVVEPDRQVAAVLKVVNTFERCVEEGYLVVIDRVDLGHARSGRVRHTGPP